MKNALLIILTFIFGSFNFAQSQELIDREALVTRNNPLVKSIDKLSSLSVGNGKFAFTVDATGLQTFPEMYEAGVPLGTQSEWGWHNFANPNKFTHDETMKRYNFRGRQELYSTETLETKRQKEAAQWFRENPHRLQLGVVGLEILNTNGSKVKSTDLKNISQELNLWDGNIDSKFEVEGDAVSVKTVCNPNQDEIAAHINFPMMVTGKIGVNFRFPYPTGKHTDDTTGWANPDKHTTIIIKKGNDFALLLCNLDSTSYYAKISWTGKAILREKEKHYFVLLPTGNDTSFSFTCQFSDKKPQTNVAKFDKLLSDSKLYWNAFWKSGGAVDFSKCTDPRARELERRVVLSQYLMAIQCAGALPPQETGLTFNSWFGRPHLEMHWWHSFHNALWGRPEIMERSMGWYKDVAYPVAKEIAQRQGFDGVRWMKMTDPWAGEAPSKVGSFLIWQQPHIVYFAEMIYRANPSKEVIEKYKDLVAATADFMYSFADYDKAKDRFVLKGIIPAQETLPASETINPPFELSYWHFIMNVAQKWRERTGLKRNPKWDELIKKLSPLASKDGLYLAAESAPDTYSNIKYTSDHMAVLGACGILPNCKLYNLELMKKTLQWVWDNWNWNSTWGWDYPMTAMNAARLGEPEKAVGALLMDKQTNTYLVSGHNYKDERLRIYLPGNGGLLTTVAMMCAGWDGCTTTNPGFPKDGKWNVVWEGLKPMP
jgi:hypothetical protein